MNKFSNDDIFVIIGASSGIGYDVSKLLNKNGAKLIVIARSYEKLLALQEEVEFSDRIFIECKDITENINELPNYVKLLKEKYGKLKGFVYCAGIGEVEPLQLVDYEKAKKEFDLNYFAPIFFAKGFADRRNNLGRDCSCVFISSVASTCCDKGHLIYSGSKAALNSSVKVIAKELINQKIRFNIVSPSAVNTSMLSDISISSENLKKYPFGIAEPCDVSNLIVFLLSCDSKFISGQNYILDSGGVL